MAPTSTGRSGSTPGWGASGGGWTYCCGYWRYCSGLSVMSPLEVLGPWCHGGTTEWTGRPVDQAVRRHWLPRSRHTERDDEPRTVPGLPPLTCENSPIGRESRTY